MTRGSSDWLKVAWLVASAAIAIASVEGSGTATFVGVPLPLGAFLWLFREHGWTAVLCAAAIALSFFWPYLAD